MASECKQISNLSLVESRLDETNKNLLNGFNCGNESIDRFLREDAYNHLGVGKGVTYLLRDDQSGELVAFYTLSASALKTSDQKQEYASVEIKMFAVNKIYQKTICESFRGKLVADFIIGNLTAYLYDLSITAIGFQYIILHSTDNAVQFYVRNGFSEMTDYLIHQTAYTEGCTPMYMSLYS